MGTVSSSSAGNCPLGAFLRENCQSDSPDSHFLDKDEKDTLQLRSGCDAAVLSVCRYHWQNYFEFYISHQRLCCDPFERHKKKINKGLRVITLEMARLYGEIRLIPGKKLCRGKVAQLQPKEARMTPEQMSETSSSGGR